MTHRIAIGFGSMALAVAAATAAQAQVYHYEPRGYAPPPVHDGGIRPGEVLIAVRAAGLSPLTRPARRGHRYVLLASDRMGGQLRVVVDAYNARIVRVVPAYDPRFAYQPVRPPGLVPNAPRHHDAPRHYRDVAPGELRDAPRSARGSAPATTGSVPDHRLAGTPPPAADPAPPRPARTPLPRPRPTIASSKAAAPETSPEAETPAQPAAQPRPAPPQSKAAAPKTETQLVPVAPLE